MHFAGARVGIAHGDCPGSRIKGGQQTRLPRAFHECVLCIRCSRLIHRPPIHLADTSNIFCRQHTTRFTKPSPYVAALNWQSSVIAILGNRRAVWFAMSSFLHAGAPMHPAVAAKKDAAQHATKSCISLRGSAVVARRSLLMGACG